MYRDWVVRRRARHLRLPALLVLSFALVASLGGVLGGAPRAVAAPGGPPDVVGQPWEAARARIEQWSPPDGSTAMAVLLPAKIPKVVGRSPVIVVRQGAPRDVSDPTQSSRLTAVPLTLGIAMPSLTGQTRAAAAQLLASDALSSVTWRPAGAGDGEIVSGQSPTPGTLVAFDDPVVASFTQKVPVPNVVGHKLQAAERLLAAAHLRPVLDGPSGRVVDQFPKPLTLVLPGSPVQLTLQPGVTVPDVVGLTVDQARQAIEQAGLVLATPSAEGRVDGQQPLAGTSADQGDTVAVTVEPLPGTIVPNVVGKTVAAARETLEQAGLRLDATDVDGRIIEQRPAAGVVVRPGTPVAVTIAVAPASRRWLPVAAGLAGLLLLAAVAAAGVLVRRLRRRRWIAQHVRIRATRDAGVPVRRDGPRATPSWRITVARHPGPAADARAEEVTHADR